ncbi:ribonuclease H-like domain-containing protein, partial [Tanacetum coccineum]
MYDVLTKVHAKQDVAEQDTKKRKGGHMKMHARKRKRPQPADDSDDEHRKCLKIVTFEGTIDSEIMERKTVIARLKKVSSPDGDYLVIYRANGNFRAFNYLLEVLHIFDMQDLFHLCDLVMKQYSEVTLEGIELILWGDLKIMIESSTEENDQNIEDGTVIHMLVERRYPLSKDLLQRMLDFGLEVEVESTAALDLIRVLNSPCFMVKSWLVQDQTVLGKDYSNLLIADSLLKTIWFINAPCYGNEALASPKANELTIPKQTAAGKGISNPFMADSLPKTTKPTYELPVGNHGLEVAWYSSLLTVYVHGEFILAGHVIILKKGWSSSLFCLKNHIVLQVEFRVETVYLGLGTVTLLLYFLLFICVENSDQEKLKKPVTGGHYSSKETDEDEEAGQKKKDATKEKVKYTNLVLAEAIEGFSELKENVAFLRNIILDDRVPANELKFLLRSLNYLGSLLEKSDTLKEKTLLPDQSKFYSGERYIYQYTCPGEDQEECVIRTRLNHKHSYSSTCPKAEATVRSTVETHFKDDPTVAAALLRLHFHDCFVK